MNEQPSHDIIMRSVAVSDAQDLIALDRALLEDGRGFLLSEDDLVLDLAERETQIAEALKDRFDGVEGIYLVAERAGRVVGAGLLTRLSKRRLRHNVQGGLGVHPEVQGEGLGRRLSEALRDWALSATAPRICRIELATLANNTRALALYESLGFVREGVQRGYLAGPDGTFIDNVLMAFYL